MLHSRFFFSTATHCHLPDLATCNLSDFCGVEKSQFHIKTALSSQPWGCHWEASVWLQLLFKTHSVMLRIIVHCRLDEVVWGEKCPVSTLQDWLSVWKQILSILHVNLFPFAWEGKKNSFLEEVCNKSLAIDDNGICACVCHLRKSNSGGVSTDLFVY